MLFPTNFVSRSCLIILLYKWITTYFLLFCAHWDEGSWRSWCLWNNCLGVWQCWRLKTVFMFRNGRLMVFDCSWLVFQLLRFILFEVLANNVLIIEQHWSTSLLMPTFLLNLFNSTLSATSTTTAISACRTALIISNNCHPRQHIYILFDVCQD